MKDVGLLTNLLEAPIRTGHGLLTLPEIKQLLEATLPLGLRLWEDMMTVPLSSDENLTASGNAVTYTPDGEDGDVFYYFAIDASPYGNIENMKKWCAQVFSADFCALQINPVAFEPPYGFYVEKDGQLYSMTSEGFTYSSKCIEWQINTVHVIEQTENAMVLEMEYIDRWFESENAEDSSLALCSGKIRLLFEDGSWKIDSPLAEGVHHEIIDAQTIKEIPFEELAPNAK